MYATIKKAQPKVLRIIENSIKNNRLSHAYLFTGPKGTYKKEVAIHFAMMLYCKEYTPCYKLLKKNKLLHYKKNFLKHH